MKQFASLKEDTVEICSSSAGPQLNVFRNLLSQVLVSLQAGPEAPLFQEFLESSEFPFCSLELHLVLIAQVQAALG